LFESPEKNEKGKWERLIRGENSNDEKKGGKGTGFRLDSANRAVPSALGVFDEGGKGERRKEQGSC